MRIAATCATLVATAAVAVPAVPAFAGDEPAAGAGGCVTNAAYARLGVGQTVSYIRAVAGDGAQTSVRFWGSGANEYQERLYTMCTPRSRDHATLTTRFQYFRGAYRAIVVDTFIGPDPD